MYGHNHVRNSEQSACDSGDCPTYARWRKEDRILEIRRRRRMRQEQRDALLLELHAIVQGRGE
jgi:hypothetical protein